MYYVLYIIIYVHIIESLYCTPETTTTLSINYISINIFKKE